MILGYKDKRTEMFANGFLFQRFKGLSSRLRRGWRS